MASHAVLFDLDDTLYDEMLFVRGAMNVVAQFLAPRAGVAPADIHDLLMDEMERSGRGRVFDVVVDELGLPDTLVATLVYVYRSARPSLEPFDDTGRLLDRLQDAGIRLGILTDGIALVQGAKVDLLELRDRMDVVVLTDAVGVGCPKPDTRGFEVACEILGVPPERTTYVANDLRKDFIGPRILGISSIHVARRQHGSTHRLPAQARPDVVVGTLEEVWPHVRACREVRR